MSRRSVGGVSAHTSSGDVAVGVAEGTAVRLDIITGSGVVTSCNRRTAPKQGDETLVLEVRSGSGDVDIHRANPAHETVSGQRLPDPAAPAAPQVPDEE